MRYIYNSVSIWIRESCWLVDTTIFVTICNGDVIVSFANYSISWCHLAQENLSSVPSQTLIPIGLLTRSKQMKRYR